MNQFPSRELKPRHQVWSQSVYWLQSPGLKRRILNNILGTEMGRYKRLKVDFYPDFGVQVAWPARCCGWLLIRGHINQCGSKWEGWRLRKISLKRINWFDTVFSVWPLLIFCLQGATNKHHLWVRLLYIRHCLTGFKIVTWYKGPRINIAKKNNFYHISEV